MHAAEMQRRAAASGLVLEARAAGRISAAVSAVQAGGPTLPAGQYPRLIWVCDEAPDLGFPIRDASLSQT
jgi:hypothetical protein